MSETKTYVFGNDGQCGGGSMMSMLAPLLQQRGLDPNLLLAMNRGGGFGNGEGSWFIWLLFILCFCGWGGNGFGFGGNGRGNIANEINNDYGRSLLMDAIGGNRNALSNLATQLNCTEGQIQSAISALTSQVQSVGNQNIIHTNSSCSKIRYGYKIKMTSYYKYTEGYDVFCPECCYEPDVIRITKGENLQK